jgi:hypothetical protein
MDALVVMDGDYGMDGVRCGFEIGWDKNDDCDCLKICGIDKNLEKMIKKKY